MSIRFKLLVVIFVFGIAPMLLVSILNYVRGVRAVEGMLTAEAQQSAARMARDIRTTLDDNNSELFDFANSRTLRDYVRGARAASKEMTRGASESRNSVSPLAASPAPGAASNPSPSSPLSPELRDDLNAFYLSHAELYTVLSCVDEQGRMLFRVEDAETGADGKRAARVQTEDFVQGRERVNDEVWSAPPGTRVLRSPLSSPMDDASQSLTVPIYLDDSPTKARGALVVLLKLNALLKKAGAEDGMLHGTTSGARSSSDSGNTVGNSRQTAAKPSRIFLAFDRENGNRIYESGPSSEPQKALFAHIAGRMKAGETGTDFYDDQPADGDRWLAAFMPVEEAGISIAVLANYSQAVGGLQRAGLSGVAVLLLAALVAMALLAALVSRTVQRIERVGAAAAAIAAGDLKQRIEIHTHDETKVLADSFNRMTDRLSEQITHEAEMRQFESFMRLSAVLTHDLKNSITALSMLVSNMERQFHREEFRADAILSLREATEKLKRTVSRLSEPVKSLSGEYRRDARPTDLIPVIRRVLAATAERSQPLYHIERRMPESLVAYVEAGRIENVVENLVINALEAMGARGGRLTIEAGEEPNGMVFFSVADTGTGMNEDFMKLRLFRAFATTKTKGIGLGLYTCREIVEAHGGRLNVESQVGVGTRFRVVLPSKPFTPRERQSQSSPSHKPIITTSERGL
ncbi:MAG TPA: ATP-binding protein [Pyrinomonadaceae bacterium]|nr:ATP-binding protein [Pyrinomonadaceae bacterium]